MLAADVVEVDVDPVRSSVAERVGHRPRAVVERRVETELVDEHGDLLVRAGAPDHPVPLELGDLGGEAADGAGRGRDPHDVIGAQLGDVEQPGVRGQAGAAEDTEVRLRRGERGVDAAQGADAAQRLPPAPTTA